MRRRLSWLGHLLRLSEETPARKALAKYCEPSTRPIGRPKTTWIATVMKDLEYSHIQLTQDLVEDIKTITEECSDREEWRYFVDSTILTKSMTVQR